MNEDDTFKRLKRTPKSEIQSQVIRAQYNDLVSQLSGREGNEVEELLAQHGWTHAEYMALEVNSMFKAFNIILKKS